MDDSGPKRRRKTALVLEGGGLRGAFSAGVVATLARNRMTPIDTIFATSSAGPCAAFFATGQSEVAIRLWENRTYDGHLISPKHWLSLRPLMDVDKLVSSFRRPIPLAVERLASSPTRVRISVTNCRSGTAEFIPMDEQNAFDLLTATMALPVAYGRVVEIHGQRYVDGGLRASIPIAPALEEDPDDIIVVLTQPRGYRKRPSKALAVAGRANYPGYPELWSAFSGRADSYNHDADQVDALERAGRLQVIRPSEPLPASRMTRNRGRIMATIQAGRNAARRWLQSTPGGHPIG